MKKWNITFALCLAFVSVACGGEVSGGGGGGDGKDEPKEPPSTLDQCNDACEQAADCDGLTSDYEDTCKDSCRATERAVERAGCESEFEDLWACAGTEFECDAPGLNDECESEAVDFGDCMRDDSGPDEEL